MRLDNISLRFILLFVSLFALFPCLLAVGIKIHPLVEGEDAAAARKSMLSLHSAYCVLRTRTRTPTLLLGFAMLKRFLGVCS